jgi:putative nucleotidyltransferase with HDIG domain
MQKKISTSLTDRLTLFLGSVSDLRDPYMMEHSSHVKGLSLQLALQSDFPRSKLKQLAHAAILHDIGKLVISETVINKPTRLTHAEYLMVQQHTILGYELIQPLNLDPLIGDAILHHHENFDGSGYPSGLSGTAITLAARIIRITDMYDALTSERAYRTAYGSEEAASLMKNNSHYFDEFLFGEFLKIL